MFLRKNAKLDASGGNHATYKDDTSWNELLGRDRGNSWPLDVHDSSTVHTTDEQHNMIK